MTEKKKLTLKSLEAEIEDLKKGFMKVAKEIGVTKGRFAAHEDEPDAHNPSTMVKK